ncbi:MAG: HK97 family phage prohead protease [Hassallia sp. WJT32-NPBG1]|jgi:phage head maturation protease|nr:HK97 family phage prohead protease [Hassallia sp. WJT32-NPBG1]
MTENAILTRFLGSPDVRTSATARSLTFPFSSTRPVTRYAWSGDNLPEDASYVFDEVLSHEKSAWNLERVSSGVCPFLRNHDRAIKLGVVEDVQFSGDRAYASIKLRRTEEADTLLVDLEDGTAGGISFGYSVQKYRVITPAKYDTQGNLTEKAILEGVQITLYEVSAEELPADPSIGFNRSDKKNLISLRSIAVEGNPNWRNVENFSDTELSMQRALSNYENAWREKKESEKLKMTPKEAYENAWRCDR